MSDLSIQYDDILTEPCKFGSFWVSNEKGTAWAISRIDLVKVAGLIGFCLFRGELYKISGKFVKLSNEREFQDILLNYINNSGSIGSGSICNAYESFLQKNGKYTISRLPIVPEESFLNDDENNCYKFFSNCFIQITASEINIYKYDQIPDNKYILFSKVQNREYAYNTHGRYIDFLKKATLWNENGENIKTIIGYLAHEFKDETTGFIIVLTEQCPDPKDGGGSGKNLFCNLLSNTTTYCSKNGKQLKFDEKFFQSWSGQRIMGISDVPKNFDFEFLKEPSTGTFILKKLFKDEVEIPVSEGPKFIVQTNFSYECTDGGLKRRIMPIEFTDFFTRSGGVDVHYGMHFPKGWEVEDWNNFDTIIVDCVQTWLKSSRKIKSAELTETGWEKQFEYAYGKNLADFIRDHFNQWTEDVNVPSETIRGQIKTFYSENDINIKYHYSALRIAQGINEWANKHGYNCTTNTPVRVSDGLSGSVTKKCYVFEKR